MSTTFVRARIDTDLKNEAAAVLSEMGLTVSDVVRIALTKIAKEKNLPFDFKVPNSKTITALHEAEAGEGIKSFNSIDELMQDLNSDD